MRVTQVGIRPTESSDVLGRPALTPELLAAVGARYSRSNEGLDAILKRIDEGSLDKSVDAIFRMIDYGHQSIADMAPVAVFIDDLSILLAYMIWSWCPTAGGQESSTRYIKLDREGLVEPELLGVAKSETANWHGFIDEAFDAYGESLAFWTQQAERNPSLTRIPDGLLYDQSEKAQKQVARMQRNYAFDRARYFLPVAAKTNMMLTMSARGWAQLAQNLLSHWLPEAVALGGALKMELDIATPRMTKYASGKGSFTSGHADELQHWSELAKLQSVCDGEALCIPQVEISLPRNVTESDLVAALAHHDNRYAFMGAAASRTAIRFGWSAVAIAEVRDLNRHRTGTKYCPLVPVGFYCASDQTPIEETFSPIVSSIGTKANRKALSLLKGHDVGFGAWLLLGTQLAFEHTTTLDKFIYEAELRTGTGAHFRYSSHLRRAIEAFSLDYPTFASRLSLGSAEPE